MCKCCHNTPTGRAYTHTFEPETTLPFSFSFENDLTSISRVKEKLYKHILEQQNTNRVPLCINPTSASYKSFAR
jgi:nemo like kinase